MAGSFSSGNNVIIYSMARRKEPVDMTRLRYVLYARKSTEDEGSQARSIKDQTTDCKKMAEDLGLHIVDVIEESKSAKHASNRKKFSQMLKDIKTSKYDGIIAWHPDRLCRNMLEAGVIVDMLDNDTIKDLRFVSHQFSNDANGKMLLGMLFVFSKQYSESLSERVQRGIDHNLEEGKSSGVPKWGYERCDDGLYRPDANFDTIREGWAMRLNGATIREVMHFWVRNNVHRLTKKTDKNKNGGRKMDITLSGIARMFHDPLYYGILVQADQSVDLRTIYDFTPMITQEEYNAVQDIGRARSKILTNKKRTTFYPLRGVVHCGVCSNIMVVGKSKSRSKIHYLYYRCDNKQCTRDIKSVRAKYIFENLYTTLSNLHLTESDFKRYDRLVEANTEQKIIELRTGRASLLGQLQHINKEIDDKADSLSRIKHAVAIKNVENQIAELDERRTKLEKDIAKLSAKIDTPALIKLTKDEFLNLAKTASDKIKAGTVIEKDQVIRKMLLNLSLDNKNTPSYIWREPFNSMVKLAKNSLGGRGGT